MSKYNNINYVPAESSPLVSGEKELWSGKPKKKAFILNQILGMAPIAIIWLAIDSWFITMFLSGMGEESGEMGNMLFFIIPFFALHLMPVWIWLSQVFTANKKWQNTQYFVTDKRIIIQNGFIAANYQSIYYKDIRNVNMHIGIIDKMLGVGDIRFDLGYNVHHTRNGRPIPNVNAAFLDIENPMEIYPRLQKIIMDIQTDIEFPNAYRPSENPGYNTEYKG
jgi:membrane protein YdbS with pleckstrin-like domain